MAEKWNSGKVLRQTKKLISRRMKKAMVVLEGNVKRRISVGQPVIRSGKSLRGLNPSKEGDPPHLLTGRLRTSISHDVRERGNEIIGRVGTDVPYAARLEFGFFGTDSRGRNISQGARPYLRPSLKETLPRLAGILTTGK